MATAVKTKRNYNVAEAAQLWIEEGGPKEYAIPMGIVTWFESRGRADVRNSIGATGLWQIYNGPNTDPRLKDPRVNARAAVAKFKDAKARGGTGFEPWVSSKAGWGRFFDSDTGEVKQSELLKLPGEALPKGGENILEDLGGKVSDIASGPIDALGGALEPLKDVGQFFLGLTELLLTPEGLRRLLKIILGGIVLIFGLNQLTKAMGGPRPGRTVRRVAEVAATKKPAKAAA